MPVTPEPGSWDEYRLSVLGRLDGMERSINNFSEKLDRLFERLEARIDNRLSSIEREMERRNADLVVRVSSLEIEMAQIKVRAGAAGGLIGAATAALVGFIVNRLLSP